MMVSMVVAWPDGGFFNDPLPEWTEFLEDKSLALRVFLFSDPTSVFSWVDVFASEPWLAFRLLGAFLYLIPFLGSSNLVLEASKLTVLMLVFMICFFLLSYPVFILDPTWEYLAWGPFRSRKESKLAFNAVLLFLLLNITVYSGCLFFSIAFYLSIILLYFLVSTTAFFMFSTTFSWDLICLSITDDVVAVQAGFDAGLCWVLPAFLTLLSPPLPSALGIFLLSYLEMG